MVIDHLGVKIQLNSKFPRKELLNRLGASKASKMYVDDKEGNTKHIGYVVNGRWFTFYNISSWEK